MNFFLKTVDPYPLTKRYFDNLPSIIKWLHELQQWTPYPITDPAKGVFLFSLGKVENIENIFIEDLRVKIPDLLDQKIDTKIFQLQVESRQHQGEALKREHLSKRIKELNKIRRQHAKDIDYKALFKLLGET